MQLTFFAALLLDLLNLFELALQSLDAPLQCLNSVSADILCQQTELSSDLIERTSASQQ